MKLPPMIASLLPRLRSPRSIAWLGGLFITVIVAMAAYDIVRGYYTTIENTGRELDAHARGIVEQTARSFQAVDVQLRHLEQQFRQDMLPALSAQDLRAYLKDQAVGLVQIDGLLVIRADGTIRASSYIDPAQESSVRLSGEPFKSAQSNRQPGLIIGDAISSTVDGRWIFPMQRRLDSSSGEFAGVVAARGRIDYFQQFYRDIRLDQGTNIILMQLDGKLLARYPHIESALGKRFPQFDQMLSWYNEGHPAPTRTVSPVDGVERFGAMRLVPDYPLAVIVTRDVAVALAPWKEQARRSIVRTLALGILAALLLVVVMRQLARLGRSEERFALAVAGANDGIVDLDIPNDRMFMSERAMQMFGVQSDVTVRSRFEWKALVQLHPEDVPLMLESFQWIAEGQGDVREDEYRVRHADGKYHWIRIRGRLVRDAFGHPTRWAGSVSDIDAGKRAAEALRQSEERFALAVAGSNDGIVDWDVVNDRMYSSERAIQILGIESGVTVRTRAQWSALVTYHPDDVQRMKADLKSFLEGHTELRDGEYRVLQPDGKYRWIRHRNKCVRDSAGRPIRVAGSVSDIDAHKRVEGQLLQAKKLEAIGTLAGGIAHDFNNILAAILGYGEMAQKDAAAGTALRRHVDAVVGAGMRAKSLVERILAFSRSGIGERAPVRVQSVVIEALDLAAASLPQHVQLERRLAAADAAVMGDPTQIHQVVMNLCANGAQAMKAKGTLTVTLDVVEKSGSMAATSALAGGRYVRLSVRDTGTGMPANVIDRIFDPFFTTREVGVGTGLGLSLVHGIVTDLGGGIDVESRVGEGASFTVYLPWTDAAAAPAVVDDVIPNGAGETILLVDDEETLVRLGEEMIAALGYEPVGFTSSAAALAAFRSSPERFNAVLTDETMPDLTGSELAREIHAIRPDLPIVMMSGFVTSALAARARDAGVFDVLAKPLVTRDLARNLASALRHGGQR